GRRDSRFARAHAPSETHLRRTGGADPDLDAAARRTLPSTIGELMTPELTVLPSDRSVDPSPVELGRRIKLLRVSRGLTLKELEGRGRISATHVSEIERGKASPTLGALRRIARALGVRPAALVEARSLPRATLTRAADRARRRFQAAGAA